MRFVFASKKLEQLYTAEVGANKYPPEVVDAFFKKMALIRAARDENDLRAFKGLHFEKLQGERGVRGERSIRLNKQFRLILRLETDEQGKLVCIHQHRRLSLRSGCRSNELHPARLVSPGQILRDELEARGWTQRDLAAILGRPEQAISEIISGSKQITPETSLELSQAFGTSAELWSNLEANYRLELARTQAHGDVIARRSRLYAELPLREMASRGWLRLHESVADLEAEVAGCLGMPVLPEPPRLAARLRGSSARSTLTYAQLAWLRRAEALAREQTGIGSWRDGTLEPLARELAGHMRLAEDVAHVPDTLARRGVRFVCLRLLSRTYLDGAAFWIEDGPVVALTLRYDRIDAFWFTLMHELAHLAEGRSEAYLDQLEDGGEDAPEPPPVEPHEEAANRLASGWLLAQDAFSDFVARTAPRFSRTSIETFAASQGRHPGIVLGRLQRGGVVPYRNLRGLLVKVSPLLMGWISE